MENSIKISANRLYSSYQNWLREKPRQNMVLVTLESGLKFVLFWSKGECSDREGVVAQFLSGEHLSIVYPNQYYHVSSIEFIGSARLRSEFRLAKSLKLEKEHREKAKREKEIDDFC